MAIEPMDDAAVPSRRHGPISRLLIFASGADPKILDQCPAAERSRYEGLGGGVLTTAVMAGIAMGVSISLAFKAAPAVSVTAGVLWGVAIFNLDRWLVSTYRSRATRRGKIAALVPRLLLSVVLGLTISEPLILLIFEPEVTAKVAAIQREEDDKAQREIEQSQLSENVKALGEEITKLTAPQTPTGELARLQDALDAKDEQISDANDELKRRQDLRDKEVRGELSGIVGFGDQATARQRDVVNQQDAVDKLKEQREHLAQLIEKAQQKIDQNVANLREQKSAMEAERNDRIERAKAANFQVNGLLIRMRALSALSSEETAVFFRHLVIALLIMLVDVLPVAGKALMGSGGKSPYENLLAAREAEVEEAAELRILTKDERIMNARIRGRERSRHLREMTRIELADDRYFHERRSRRLRRMTEDDLDLPQNGTSGEPVR
ncbi:DUF4407 domain-containing protein [Acrocarpospora catenulata]|uniref:DUF4407 domain-containing protein n=1 Tax=Acrocarpospora catenulata TaxID=2836182 RepID=UPI001BD98D57|nr:DUF4407 domain-containing protein [Acrocarpospora catenulata]